MLFYLISLAFLVFVFFSSFGEKTTKAQILNVSGCIVAVVCAYYVFSEDLTDSTFWNLVLAVLPIVGGLMALLSLTSTKTDSTPTSQNTPENKPFFNVDIVDDESSAAPHSATYTPQAAYTPQQTPYAPYGSYAQQPQYAPQTPYPAYGQQPQYAPQAQQAPYAPYTQPNQYAPQAPAQPEPQPQYEPISYINAKIEGFGSCDVVESAEFVKITMRAEGKEYEFYVKDQNVVAYRAEGMSKPQSY
jgi:hypothetical protein